MSEYTFPINFEPLKANNTIQTIVDIDALCAPAKAALTGYVSSLTLPAAETQHMLWANVGLNIYIEQLTASYYLPSLGAQTPAPAIKRSSTLADKVAEISSLTGRWPKCQFLLWVRPNATAAWQWVATDLIQNYGNRVNYLNLLIPYLTQGNVLVAGRGTQVGLQFISDAAISATLPQASDRLVIQGSVRVELSLLDAKKNDETNALKARLTALENLLGIMGAPTATTEGRSGLVPKALAGQGNRLLRGDCTWQSPTELTGLRTRTNATTVPFNANAFTLAQPRELQWIDGGVANLNLPANAGTLLRNDPLFDVAKELYESQEFNNAGGRWWKRDENNGVWSAWKELAFLEGNQVFTGDKSFAGFTRLGDTAIKVKLITGTTSASQGVASILPHGITSPVKIISATLAIEYVGGNWVPASYTNVGGYEANLQWDTANVAVIARTGNSASILSKPFSVLLTYIA
ncbi:hypothetical protein [Microcoleus sp. bin38.metabat.b11b12b14.051]|uniref:hypothetical protein n=1 Tax=Microcoleus sp. bin38.metabat.b11b12b14.051 TaxID=2742709 RepID=UPI0025F45223|nr:hypothetical protein [Microcoleus sp. bin38.metabat.b11b12b14.051]